MNPPIRVLIVDDHPVVRKGMVQVISECDELRVVAEAGGAAEALGLIDSSDADVVVTDFDMPGTSGLQLARALQQRTQKIPVVLLTLHDNEQLFNEAINCGVSAYLLKDDALDSIVDSIRAVARGDSWISPSLSRYVVRRGQRGAALNDANTGLSTLTPTERRILALVADSLSSKEIADQLSVSYRTITTHRANISTKLGLAGKAPLLNFALTNRSAILSLLD